MSEEAKQIINSLNLTAELEALLKKEMGYEREPLPKKCENCHHVTYNDDSGYTCNLNPAFTFFTAPFATCKFHKKLPF